MVRGDHAGDGDEQAHLQQLLEGALRAAMQPSADGTSRNDLVREMLAEVCAIARDRELYPEQVLVMLKGAWRRIADPAQLGRHAHVILDDVISSCIELYFAEASAGGSSRGPQQNHRPAGGSQ